MMATREGMRKIGEMADKIIDLVVGGKDEIDWLKWTALAGATCATGKAAGLPRDRLLDIIGKIYDDMED